MALINLNKNGVFIKMMFDGHDFIRTEIGSILCTNKNLIEPISYSNNYDNVDEFVRYCINNYNNYNLDPYLPRSLMSKYHVGLYSLSMSNDVQNPWKDRDYILFNTRLLQSVMNITNLKDVSFWVCPAYDINGDITGLGFRVINQVQVMNAFKWLFMSGNDIIYGKDTVNEKDTCYVVEGFRDYVALTESGFNSIGLGSVAISDIQKEYICNLKDPILLLDNDSFGLQQSLSFRESGYKVATLIQTKEKDAWDTYSKNIPLKMVEIK